MAKVLLHVVLTLTKVSFAPAKNKTRGIVHLCSAYYQAQGIFCNGCAGCRQGEACVNKNHTFDAHKENDLFDPLRKYLIQALPSGFDSWWLSRSQDPAPSVLSA